MSSDLLLLLYWHSNISVKIKIINTQWFIEAESLSQQK